MKQADSKDNALNILLSLMIDDIQEPIQRSYKTIKNKSKDSSRTIQTHLPGELYHLNCFRNLTRLNSIPKRLEISLALMKYEPDPNTLRDTDIHRTEYIEHNFANYIFTLASSRDIAYACANSFLNLGLDDRQVNNQTITQNSWVKNYGIRKALKPIEKLVEKYTFERNLLAHQGEIPKLNALDYIGMLDGTEHILERIGKKPFIDPVEKNRIINDIMNEEIIELRKEISNLKNATIDLAEKLLPIYKYWKQQPASMRSAKATFSYEKRII